LEQKAKRRRRSIKRKEIKRIARSYVSRITTWGTEGPNFFAGTSKAGETPEEAEKGGPKREGTKFLRGICNLRIMIYLLREQKGWASFLFELGGHYNRGVTKRARLRSEEKAATRTQKGSSPCRLEGKFSMNGARRVILGDEGGKPILSHSEFEGWRWTWLSNQRIVKEEKKKSNPSIIQRRRSN